MSSTTAPPRQTFNEAAPLDEATAARRRYFPAVEGMRGVAALLVFGGHFIFFSHPPIGSWATLGSWSARFGVVLFFGISGFLLYRPFVAARHARRSVGSMAPSYLWRRAVRILPAYWVALSLAMLWPTLELTFVGPWWVYYGLLQSYDIHWLGGGLPVAWTLCVEVTFYLALPLLAILLAKRGAGSGNRDGLLWELAILVPLGLFSIIAYGLTVASPSNLFLTATLVGTFGWFVWGMLLAVVQVEHSDATSALARFLSRPWLCWPLGIGIFALMPLEVLPDLGLEYKLYEATQLLLLGLAATLLLAPAMFGDGRRPVRFALANRVMVFVGTISYGIYLYHYPLVRSLLDVDFVLDSGHPVLFAGGLTLLGCVVLGSASWYLVERPLMRRARSGIAITRRRQPADSSG